MIDRLEQTLQKPVERTESIHFQFQAKTVSGNDVLTCDDLSMGFDEKRLFDHLSLFIKKGDHVFLLGPNGCGKTTLFKILMERYAPKSGTVRLGANVHIGYYDQTQDDLNRVKTIFEEISDSYPMMTQTEIRNALAAFLFCGDDVFQPIGTLSGGERAKVALLKLMLSGANLLLLDEPTNHLDIASREALEQALIDYEGTLFVISHDRYFINKLASRVCYMTDTGLQTFEGNYDYYIEKQKIISQPQTAEVGKGKRDYQQKKEEEAAKRKLQNQIRKTEEEIEAVEADVEQLKQQLAAPECATDYVKAMELTEQLQAKEQQLEQLYEQWEALSQE